ncbi:MAG TPA: hypothetical protein VKB77_09875 [Terriglobales bacterium]|nr:hypothetical protein [Terriglobales bacterium]
MSAGMAFGAHYSRSHRVAPMTSGEWAVDAAVPDLYTGVRPANSALHRNGSPQHPLGRA